MKRLGLLFYLFIFTLLVHSQEFKASAPSQVAEGENFRVQYVVTDENPSGFKGPDFDSSAFELLAGPYTSTYSSYQYVNGKASSNSSVTYTYTLCAVKTGKYTIPAASVTAGGKRLTSNRLTIQVVAGNGGNAGAGSRQSGHGRSAEPQMQESGTPISGKDLFITATASKTRVYEQEAILLTYKVYTTVNLTSLNPEMPDLKGFHVQQIELPRTKSFTQENYNGRTYNTVVWSQYVLFPQQTGKLTIPSLTFEGIVAQRVRSMDPFDAFFNSGSSYTEVQKKIKTPSIQITVDPLPERPKNYSGGVGRFNVQSVLSPESVKTGEALTLRITVSGVGNMKLLKTPQVDVPKDFETYDPKITDQTKITKNGMEGSKTFEFVYVPRNPGKYTIPPVSFCYFDLAEKQYKTLQTEAYTLEIGKGKGGQQGSVSSYNKEDVELLNSDIRHIKKGDVSLKKAGTALFFGSGSYIWGYVVPFLIFALLMWLFRKRAIENANVALMRTKKANKMARKRLRTAKRMLTEQKKEVFYDEVMRALYGYVGDKLNIPAEKLNRENIRENLEQHGVDPTLATDLLKVLDECEFARFAPAGSGDAMDQFYERVITIIENVDNSIKK